MFFVMHVSYRIACNRIVTGIVAAAALAAVPVHAQEVQYVVYDYDYSSDHITIDGFTAYEPGEYILNDSITPFYSLIFLYFTIFIRSFFVLCVVYSLIFL